MPPLLEALAGGFDRNLCYVLGCARSGEGALVDAGVPLEGVFAAFERHGLRPVALLVTHSHGDHLSEGTEFVRRSGAVVYAFDREVEARLGGPRFVALSDGDAIPLGEERIEALHTPGHSPDSACFHVRDSLFTGDTLFVGRTGRTVAPRSSVTHLFRSVERLKRLDPDTTILPGHDYGPTATSTLRREMESNLFLRAETEEEFIRVMESYERERRRG
ncbi:MAG: MBL fold metallo-hydrolase [Gemmatimonadota bacterium]